MPKYLSEREIQELLKREHELQDAATIIPEYENPPLEPIYYRECVHEKGVKPSHSTEPNAKRAESEPTEATQLLSDEYAFLKAIIDNPGRPYTHYFGSKGILGGGSQGQRISESLQKKGFLVFEVQKNPSPRGGAPIKVAVATVKACEWVQAYERRQKSTRASSS